MANCVRCGKKIGFLVGILYEEEQLCFDCIRQDEKATKAAKLKAKAASNISSVPSQPKTIKQNTADIIIKENSAKQATLSTPFPANADLQAVLPIEPGIETAASQEIVKDTSDADLLSKNAITSSTDENRIPEIVTPRKESAEKHFIFSAKKLWIFSAVASVFVLAAFGLGILWPGNLRSPKSSSMEISEIVAKVIPATVFISVETDKGSVTGSGFFALDGKIFTNSHVVKNAKKISIKTHEGKIYEAKIWDENKDLDLAVLTADVDKKAYENLTFASGIPISGNEIVVIGSPLGYEQTVSNGLISAVRHYDNDLTILQISAPISPGSSGSPVVDMRGQVVGVATLTSTRGQNLNFAVSPTSANRHFSLNDTYLVQSNAPIVKEDSRKDSLRVTATPFAEELRSFINGEVKVVSTEKFEIRTVVKVRNVSNGETYWIDSASVKKPLKMKLADFVAKFNEHGTTSESISSSSFQKEQNIHGSLYRKDGNVMRIETDADENITRILVAVPRKKGEIAEVHSWILQTIRVFYPNSLISEAFYKDLFGMVIDSILLSAVNPGHHAQVEKFPILFDMDSQADRCVLTVFVSSNENLKSRPNEGTMRQTALKDDHSSSSEKTKFKKTDIRDERYLMEIRAIIQEMPVINRDIFTDNYVYMPEKYSSYVKRLMFKPAILHARESGKVLLVLSIGFQNADWVFTEKIIFNCDGENFAFDDLPDEPTREVIWGDGIYEMYTIVLTANELVPDLLLKTSFMQSMLAAKTVKVRFDGSRRVADRTLSKKDIQNLSKAYEVYKKLVVLEERWSD
jgi:hypothetical protein